MQKREVKGGEGENRRGRGLEGRGGAGMGENLKYKGKYLLRSPLEVKKLEESLRGQKRL